MARGKRARRGKRGQSLARQVQAQLKREGKMTRGIFKPGSKSWKA